MLTHGVAGVLDDLRVSEAAGFSSYWVAQVGLIDALTLLAAHGAFRARLGGHVLRLETAAEAALAVIATMALPV